MGILEVLGAFVTLNEIAVLAMFLTFIFLLFRGVPVAFALVGVSLIFVLIAEIFLDPFRSNFRDVIEFDRTGIDYQRLGALGSRLFGNIVQNPVLVALPMFIYMGLMLDQSGVAQRMMHAMQKLFGGLKGGLSLTVLLIGIILAASTGVIGASVTLLGVMALPAMMKQNYSKPIATGTIASAGTLGILIPPSIMLVIMSDQLAISLGDLFMGALFPGLLLGALYITFIVVFGLISPSSMPAPEKTDEVGWPVVKEVLLAVVPPMFLILLVLGSIFAGIATPTEASGLGAFGATMLAVLNRKLNFKVFVEVARSTLNTAGYIVGIFLAANFFAFVLRRYGGDEIIENHILGIFDNPYMIVAFILFLVFLLGFLLDWIEITIIIMPLMLPIIQGLELAVPGFGQVQDPAVVWFAILVAVTLQTSFLTPPVGFALFYLKGVCPPGVSLSHIYKGVIPFVLLQLLGLGIVFAFPALTTWLPSVAYGN
ncbi:C4-dicarboxylate ABC transporter [Thalassobacter stenotrophicus]|jgi:tripartite ATP-independent transporter DctM subunit|uniref:Neu5Ac permease n=2 Tax=Thalassobacter stenotrophicus TaxID=266809 RepID=A0A0P1F191_9RHOB|nr:MULTISPECIES: TRAP transporter large permease subunit [Thalassobacter]KGK78828.1 C4-dicarboxylate ABC transporter [Thalassobacter stenotrophicus]KGL00913.1 C4-dicarboxylate ABC transporter [Thalassobacter sp. 16PALIMAR09]PVZ48460.1 C4-dicarboxylate ABC transporter [Thalassobacter stenotrophicus]CUH61268.1 Neu5Ac permease [Thalassobacter stenotrophicus]SHI61133.1 TRAP transporter, DctM subunit [Thalassobacter stenotrophicus DSM 16310]